MKDILINYPIKILQQELINIRTSYRLEKKRIIEILKDMKSIKKLTKEELIDLLIKYNYDISKLPKLEDLIKPKKERKPRAKKEPTPKQKEINDVFKDIPKLDDVFKDIDKKDKYKYLYDKKTYKYTDKDKQVLKDIIKKMYEIIDKYDVIKKDLLFIKDEIINLAKLNNERIDDKYINYNEFIDKYLLSKLNTALTKLELDVFDIFSGSISFNDIITNIIDSYYTSRALIYNKFDLVVYNNLMNDKFDIEDEKKSINNSIERDTKKQELLKKKEELLKKKNEEERKELKPKEPEPKKNEEEPNKDINKIIDIPEKNKKITTDEFIEIQDNLRKDIQKYLPLYIPLFNMTSLLSFLKVGRQDIKMLNIFLTPQSIAKKIIDFSNINNDNKKDTFDILEPTAGTGNLIAELVKENPEKYKIDAIEAVKEIYYIGAARFNNFNNIKWQQENFLNYKTNKKYDYIFMNPPFNINVRNKQVNDIDFVNYAYNFLKNDGKICALISSSFLTNSKPKYKKFKEFIENNNIETLEINEGFKEDKTIAKEMQTKIKMTIVIINKIKEIETIF